MEDSKRDLRLFLVPIGIVLLLTIVLMIVVEDFVREVIVLPLLHLYWVADLIFSALPQTLLWGVLLLFLLRIALRSLATSRKKSNQPAQEILSRRLGRVNTWSRRIQLVNKGRYSKWAMARHLGELALDALSHESQYTRAQLRDRLRAGELDAPPEIRAYLQACMEPSPAPQIRFFDRLKRLLGIRDQSASALDIDLNQVVLFLEDQLEVSDDR